MLVYNHDGREQELQAGDHDNSFPCSAWERTVATLCVAGDVIKIKTTRSVSARHSHAERGNEIQRERLCLTL